MSKEAIAELTKLVRELLAPELARANETAETIIEMFKVKPDLDIAACAGLLTKEMYASITTDNLQTVLLRCNLLQLSIAKKAHESRTQTTVKE